MVCARVIRGMRSMAMVVTPASLRAFTISRFMVGWRDVTRIWSLARTPISSVVGGRTLRTTSAPDAAEAASGAMEAPSSTYMASGNPALAGYQSVVRELVYPQIFNIEADPKEQVNLSTHIGAWAQWPYWELIEAYTDSTERYPNPPAHDPTAQPSE